MSIPTPGSLSSAAPLARFSTMSAVAVFGLVMDAAGRLERFFLPEPALR
jgi:hypothetical protein